MSRCLPWRQSPSISEQKSKTKMENRTKEAETDAEAEAEVRKEGCEAARSVASEWEARWTCRFK